MKTNAAGIKILHEFESCKLKAYKCPAGVWTIGWGNTWYEDGSSVKEGGVITQARADSLFKFVLAKFEDMANRAITSDVNENQFSAFVSALYNVGHGSKFKDGLIVLKNGQPSTLLKTINLNPTLPVIGDLFKEWTSKNPDYRNGLLRRRTAEANLYFTKP